MLSVTMMFAQADEAEIFPAVVRGWALAPETQAYTPENLYQYIDGASELYISYGFVALTARLYARAGQPDISVDVFDMGAPGNAFGIFAHSQENPVRDVGEDSEYLDGLLRFWQGRYYVSLLSSPETPESRSAVMELGKVLAERLPPAISRPAALALLPEAGLIAASVRYFRHPAWQNTYAFIAAENILGIGPDTEVLLARYELGGQRPIVLLVRYLDAASAQRALAMLSQKFGLPAGAEATVQLPDKKFFAAALGETTLAAVWHGGGAAPALQLLAAVRRKIASFENRK